ncbi:hypothetical protein AM486_28910 (plasmid) [Klebsiella pneumoniae]|nr:hypothetical protein [Klebsiella pneumoniae]ASC14851.1 hypothetical protein AM486_28910 [Klebsiella pneumoniae]
MFDITDETNIKATSDAVSSLTGTVTNQGNTLTSQGQSITALNNALDGVKGDVAKKADASAVSSLTNRVTQTEKDIRSQADSLTSLNTSLKQQATRGANVLPDGSFDPMPSAMFSVMPAPLSPVKLRTAGPKACVLRAVRSTTRTRRIITIPISFQACRFAITRFITWRRGLSCRLARPPIRPFIWCWVFLPGFCQWLVVAWPERESLRVVVDNWTKVSGYLTNNRTALKQAMVRISIPNTPKVRLGDAFLMMI